MTRETKIGLLVGLAFIIVIGILLSDHLTAATEQPQANLVQAGNNVRSAIAVPGGSSTPITQVQVPQQVAPQAPVTTREEMMHRPPAVTVVQVGPANNSQTALREAEHTASEQPAAGSTAVNSNNVPKPRLANSSVPSSLERVANAHHEPVVPVGEQTTAQPPQLAAAGKKQYQAQAGDTVSRMAGRFLGANTKANRDLIINANPSLKQNPDMVIVGKTYLIPTSTSTSAAHTDAPRLPDKVAVVDNHHAAAADPDHVYTVKPGDTLTQIALDQLGTPNAVSAIVELNKLPDANHIFPNMKLRLPAKPISMADSR